MPRAWLPQAMQQISLVTPHAWSLIAYNQLLNTRQPDLAQVASACLMLTAFSGGYLLLGWWRFSRTA
jgi:ABC-2 type transport system permease protein